jgi:hypothetical protein
MPSRAAAFLFAAMLCVTPAALVAQDRQAPAAPATTPVEPARNTAGPRLQPAYKSYEPAIARTSAVTTAAAADRTTITISTLGLVLLIVLLILLIK